MMKLATGGQRMTSEEVNRTKEIHRQKMLRQLAAALLLLLLWLQEHRIYSQRLKDKRIDVGLIYKWFVHIP